jgi:hypothetical protein
MQFKDYTGDLNHHGDYLNVIKQLEKKSQYIEYVLVDEEDIEFIEKFKDLILSKKAKNKWWGTHSSGKSDVYKLRVSPQIFKYLRGFETFCKIINSDYGDRVENTDFGINDIAFFDNQQMPLLFTTTHEGYITIREDLMK